ncbi:calponin-3 [Egretta garzetta]|uniref:calponin-3 n=1 Tax=Egretta garzetta TaxID=188379 RepID=UPI00163C3D66|nr:calponin-3 [Egretta garzetta]
MPVPVGPAASSGSFFSQAYDRDHKWQRPGKCLSLWGGGKRGLKAADLRFDCEKGAEKMQHGSVAFEKYPSTRVTVEVVSGDASWIALKYDPQIEEDLRNWIEEVTGLSIGANFQLGLKDGIILCELINKLQPGSVKKINQSKLNWHQLENIGNFIKAIQVYGMKPHDIFEANDLFENGNMTQVQTTLVALAGLAKTKGFHTTIDIGVKYAEKQARSFDAGKLKAGQSVIGLQMGTNKCASQAGMTAYGTRRHLYDPKMQTDKPFDQTTISLQMGTNKGASQAGMLAPGTRRDIYDQKHILQPVDNSTISLQMGTNKVASQKGMSVYGLGRQVYDPKYCAAPTEPVIHNGSQGTGTNGSEISDSDYQAEYPDDYHGEYQDDYQRDYHGQYSDQGIDY